MAFDVVPRLGAKLASLTCRDRELLVQPAHDVAVPQPGDDYLRASGLCGWDEMFPTIVGEGLPDHGELWSLPWSAAVDNSGLRTWAGCATVPVRFERTLRLTPSSLSARYDVRNLSQAPVEVMWAAHPQFLLSSSSRLSADVLTWEQVSGVAATADPVTGRLCEAVAAGGTAKWWSGRDERPRRVRLSDDVLTLEMTWTSDLVRHVGIWVDMAALASECAVSVQPSTSWHDDLNLARRNGSALVVPPGATVGWTTRLQVGPVAPGQLS